MSSKLSGRFSALGFFADRHAMGAVEFALVAPFLLVLYLGGTQISMALTVNRKVQHVASTINDLVTQSDSLKADDVKGIFNVATSIMTPYDLTPLGIAVTQVKIDSKGLQTVDWNYPNANIARLGKGTAFTLPAEFKDLRDRYVIVAQTNYTFKPVAGYFGSGAIPMGGTSYLNPRNGTRVDCPDC